SVVSAHEKGVGRTHVGIALSRRRSAVSAYGSYVLEGKSRLAAREAEVSGRDSRLSDGCTSVSVPGSRRSAPGSRLSTSLWSRTVVRLAIGALQFANAL